MIFNKKIDDNIDFNDTLLRDADTEKKSFFNKSKKSIASYRLTDGEVIVQTLRNDEELQEFRIKKKSFLN